MKVVNIPVNIIYSPATLLTPPAPQLILGQVNSSTGQGVQFTINIRKGGKCDPVTLAMLGLGGLV